ncbi:MAG: HEAT repeat domain-containing protein, partial [bacterium]|nr:HEAT repeat domain-containing protein [bacterium]
MPTSRGLRFAGLALAVALVVAASQPSAVRAAFERLLRFIELGGEPVLASVPVISEHEIEELRLAPPQEQAERLLERAINGYRGANELIEAELGNWSGEIKIEGRLDALFRVAIDSSNLRVRAAAIEIYLAAFSIEKTLEQVAYHQEVIREHPEEAPWHLWVLGFLANRDVARAEILDFLLPYLDDPETEIRHWAVEGMAYSGDEAIIPHLLRVFHDDPEPFVRERAACSLA